MCLYFDSEILFLEVYDQKNIKVHKYNDIYSAISSVQFSSVQSLSRVRLLAAPWTAARQASLSITNSQSLLKLMSIESMMPSNHPILCCPVLLLPSIFPSIMVFSNESDLCSRWSKFWSFSFSCVQLFATPWTVTHQGPLSM